MDYCEPCNVYPIMDVDKDNEYCCTLTILSNDACIFEDCLNVSGVEYCKKKECKYLKTIKKNQSNYVNADYLD